MTMQHTVVEKVRNKITHGKFGGVFFVSSFPEYDEEYVTKLLALFEKEGLVCRLSKGVYVKAIKTRFGVLYPSAADLVSEIAKRDSAEIIPTGVTAANQLGLSTQVPMKPSFLTTGSSRRLVMGDRTVTLKHGAPRNFAFKSPLMRDLVQALRCIGEKNLSQENEAQIANLLAGVTDRKLLEHDLLLAPVWMRGVIKRNLKGGTDE